MIAAGMGGNLIIRILTEGKMVVDSLSACILQPQSEIEKVRRYLAGNGLVITDEDMVEEEGKFYPMMRVVHGIPEPYEDHEYRYGKKLLERKHPVLHKFLLREKGIQESILEQLAHRTESESARSREIQILKELWLTRRALKDYGG